MHCVKTTPIQFISDRCYIKKQKGHKAALSGYYVCLLRDLLLMPLGADTHTYTNVHGPRNQVCMGHRHTRAWFKK